MALSYLQEVTKGYIISNNNIGGKWWIVPVKYSNYIMQNYRYKNLTKPNIYRLTL